MGRLWQEGKLADKVATSFTSSQTAHGGQESTILALNNTFYHWGMVVLPLGYTVQEVFAAGGNPYGASFVSGHRVAGPDEKRCARPLPGSAPRRYAAVVGRARDEGVLEVKRPRAGSFAAMRS